jgi:hypothetical protein
MAKRKPNKRKQAWRPKPPDPAARFRWQWKPHEYKQLHPYTTGTNGGLQQLINRLWKQTTPDMWCEIDAFDHERVQHYCRHTGPGGPNQLLRDICGPVYRRTFGIELSWS